MFTVMRNVEKGMDEKEYLHSARDFCSVSTISSPGIHIDMEKYKSLTVKIFIQIHTFSYTGYELRVPTRRG